MWYTSKQVTHNIFPMWKKYSSELCIGVVVINLVFSVWAWTQMRQEIASLRQRASDSQQIPSGFAPEAGKPAGEGVSSPSGGAPAISPDIEKLFKEMNAKTPPPPVMGAAGNPGTLPSPQDQKPAAQKGQPKK